MDTPFKSQQFENASQRSHQRVYIQGVSKERGTLCLPLLTGISYASPPLMTKVQDSKMDILLKENIHQWMYVCVYLVCVSFMRIVNRCVCHAMISSSKRPPWPNNFLMPGSPPLHRVIFSQRILQPFPQLTHTTLHTNFSDSMYKIISENQKHCIDFVSHSILGSEILYDLTCPHGYRGLGLEILYDLICLYVRMCVVILESEILCDSICLYVMRVSKCQNMHLLVS